MSLVCVTPPATEPLSLHEVRIHLRLDSTNVEPCPASPVAALASAGAGNVNVGDHRYLVTFVTADGETQGGDQSTAVSVSNVGANGKVALSEIALGGAAVIARRVYRTKANADVFFLLTTISNNTATTYTDNTADASLGVEVPSQNTTGDPEIAALITTARTHIENYLNRKLITQQWQFKTSCFPSCGELPLPLAPVQAVDGVSYLDISGASQTLASTEYELEPSTLPAVIHRAYQKIWPSVQASRVPVTVLFTVGYGSLPTDVPRPIRQAIQLLIGNLYENRDTNGPELLQGATYRALLDTYRVRCFV